MIKNEEKIIKRCIEKLLIIADAICVSDTGSTDNTLEILAEYLPTLTIPTIVVNHEWKNFGHNRTLSYVAAQKFCNKLNWKSKFCYGLLLDADMNLVVTDKFIKDDLTNDGYNLIQKNNAIEYGNKRLLKLSRNWKCVGVTHEYWCGANCDDLATLYINDIGDGGCKTDKFIRDEQLLTQGLIDEPKNARYMFYLAQTLQNLKKYDEAILMYKRRIDAKDWYEEEWYSMYMLSKIYYELNNLTEMEYWGMRAYDFNKNRGENIYFLTRIFREKSLHFKAWHYMQLGKTIKKPNDKLFIEYNIYEHLFDYEKTILSYYVQPHKRIETLRELINYYNKHDNGVCYSNIQYYVDPIKHKSITKMNFLPRDDYVASSTSMLHRQNGMYILNIRYVNYRINKQGQYHMMVDGVLQTDKPIRTRNFTIMMDENLQICNNETMKEMHIDFPSKNNTHIKGIEDLRLYQDGDIIKWIGCSSEYSHDQHLRQITGTYDIENNKLLDGISILPPYDSTCEKNWIPYDPSDNKIIYSWHPFTIGKFVNDKLTIIQTQDTPKFFKHMRGSTNVIEYNNNLYCMTHIVIYSTPRKYYHQIMRINKNTNIIEAYTNPFYFCNNYIEYTLGFDIKNDTINVIASQNDMNPILITIDMNDCIFYNL